MTPEELPERLWDFAARIGKVVDALPDARLGRHVAGQLVRCGTSSAPNYDEACAAEISDLLDESMQPCNIFGRSVVIAKVNASRSTVSRLASRPI